MLYGIHDHESFVTCLSSGCLIICRDGQWGVWYYSQNFPCFWCPQCEDCRIQAPDNPLYELCIADYGSNQSIYGRIRFPHSVVFHVVLISVVSGTNDRWSLGICLLSRI